MSTSLQSFADIPVNREAVQNPAPPPTLASSISSSRPSHAAHKPTAPIKHYTSLKTIHAAEYHRKHAELSRRLGSPIVDRCGNNDPVYPSHYDGEATIEFDKMQDIETTHRLVTDGHLDHYDGYQRLKQIETRAQRYTKKIRVLAFGPACMAISLFAFNAQPWDLLPTFILGCVLGWMQLVVATKSRAFADLFPFLVAVSITVASLILGSVFPKFHWTAIAEGTIAIVLPSYTMLVATGEVLKGQIVPGSSRIASAVFYTMMLSFGIGSGRVMYDLCSQTPSSAIPGSNLDVWSGFLPMNKVTTGAVNVLAISVFTIFNSIILQARWTQLPGMVLVASSFVLINHWVNVETGMEGPVLNMVGAFFSSLLAQNLGPWTRDRVIILVTPTLFFSVPGGLLAIDGGYVDFLSGGSVLVDLRTIMAVLEASVGIWVGLRLASLLNDAWRSQRRCLCGRRI